MGAFEAAIEDEFKRVMLAVSTKIITAQNSDNEIWIKFREDFYKDKGLFVVNGLIHKVTNPPFISENSEVFFFEHNKLTRILFSC